MKDLKDYLVKESLGDITVMPDQEGPIDEIDLSVNNKKVSKDTIKKLEKYFPVELDVHLYDDENWDKTLKELASKYTKEEIDNIKDDNSLNITIYKYEDDYFACGKIDDKQVIILSCEMKL